MLPVQINKIDATSRIRKELGDIDELANSIKEFGQIQPIILRQDFDNRKIHLVVGERRLRALQRLGTTELQHGINFLWLDENNDSGQTELFFRSVELEENLRRKELTWQEELTAKQELLELMQNIHGVAKIGKPREGESSGFGVRTLAAMLGESPATTSKDLEVARAIKMFPHLKRADTKESARRQLSILGAVAAMTIAGKEKRNAQTPQDKNWKLYEGNFNQTIHQIQDGSVDLVYTDLPFGVDLSQMSKHTKGVVSYQDGRDIIVGNLENFARESFRILHEDRFAVVFFGFNYYHDLVNALKSAGFAVNLVPVVWYKHTRSTENPNTRYANAYDPGIVAWKGRPVFIRPGQANVIEIAPVPGTDRLQIAQQPVELVTKFIKDMVAPGATVVDFMAGSGTTGVAAVKAGCNVIMFEKEPSACAVIKARMGAL
jgi:ParB/RepB/Spo0J family partition protein